jgi:hypothetical protein
MTCELPRFNVLKNCNSKECTNLRPSSAYQRELLEERGKMKGGEVKNLLLLYNRSGGVYY